MANPELQAGPVETLASPLCTQCRHPLPEGARLCGECKSYQDWRGYISASSSVLALLVALVSVLSATAPRFYELVHHRRSNVSSALVTIRGLKLSAALINTGDAPAVFDSAMIIFSNPKAENLVRLDLDSPSEAMLTPGPHLLNFTARADLSKADVIQEEIYIDDQKGKPIADVSFFYIDSDGKRVCVRSPLRAATAEDLLDDLVAPAAAPQR